MSERSNNDKELSKAMPESESEKVHIIADKPVADCLIARYRGQALDLSNATAHSDIKQLIVFAHTADPYGQRSDDYGLELLEQFLFSFQPPNEWELRIDVLGFLDKQNYGKYAYLFDNNINYYQLPSMPKNPDDYKSLDQENSEKLIKAVYARRIEDINRHLRHKFSDLRRPAVRVLLGAYQAGHINKECFLKIINALKSDITDIDSIIENYPHKQVGHIAESPDNNSQNARKTYFLCDDQVDDKTYIWDCTEQTVKTDNNPLGSDLELGDDDSGWGPVLACVTKSTVRCFKSPGSMLKQLKNKTKEIEAVFLDYQLKEDNGAHYLAHIKNIQFDLPIIMFTAFDDSTIAKWCLSHGASGYFVKETYEKEGRISLRAYEDLKNAIDCLPKWNKIERALWRRFINFEKYLDYLAEKKHYNKRYTDVLSPRIAWHLRMAFFWLFSSGTHPITEHNRAENIGIHAIEAFSELLKYHYYIKKGGTEKWLDYVHGQTYSDLITQLELEGLVNNGIQNDLDKVGHIEKIYGKVTHSTTRRAERKDIVKCLEYVILLIERYIGMNYIDISKNGNELNRLVYSVQELNKLRIPKSYFKNIGRTHPEIADLGAQDFIKGWKKLIGLNNDSNSKGFKGWRSIYKKYSILFIDDEPEKWESVFKVVFGERNVIAIKKIDKKIKYKDYDLILLDLKMPNPEDGLKTLKKIKKECLAIPVVMLTSTDEARWTRECLKAGADNYFLKGIQKGWEMYSVVLLTGTVQILCDNFGKDSASKKFWENIHGEIEAPQWGINQNGELRLKDAVSAIRWENANQINVKNYIADQCINILAAYIRTLTVTYQNKNKIDINSWILNGLSGPRWSLVKDSPKIHSDIIILALECGKLLERLINLEVAIKCVIDHINIEEKIHCAMRNKIDFCIPDGVEDAFMLKEAANEIWETRIKAAKQTLVAIQTEDLVGKIIYFAKRWLSRVKGRLNN